MALRHIAVIALLTVAAIAVHESGHFLVYKLAGCPVVVTLQSVRPVTPAAPAVDRWAKAAGPLASLGVAALLLWVSTLRHSFAWVTASFTNATLRLFPLAMDLARAVRARPPFSDEGEVALALLGPAAGGRIAFLSGVAAVSLLLAVLAAREYRFEGRAVLKTLGVYLASLAVGIAVVIVDELTR